MNRPSINSNFDQIFLFLLDLHKFFLHWFVYRGILLLCVKKNGFPKTLVVKHARKDFRRITMVL